MLFSAAGKSGLGCPLSVVQESFLTVPTSPDTAHQTTSRLVRYAQTRLFCFRGVAKWSLQLHHHARFQ